MEYIFKDFHVFFSDSQHKIMNFKLEDFDMVKTIGTGKTFISLNDSKKCDM